MSDDAPMAGAGESAQAAVADGSAEPRARRRRGRTALLIATAAVLGLVAGTCTGFVVQAGRAPTKLPPLSQPVVAQAEGAGPEPLSAAQDHRVKTDGDLRKLLLPRPKGAKEPDWAPEEDGWLDLAEYAGSLKNSDREFGDLIRAEFRRGAGVTWSQGHHNTQIRLVQYRQNERLAAFDRAGRWNVDDTRSWGVPGSGNGMVYLFKPETKPGYLPLYKAQAAAARGDIALEIWVFDSKPIPKTEIMDLAKRQLERL
ncbi:hypothetical protein AB0912_09960 [Streptomyces sp. NPDC007084]|uniref:hypothetical protein n=1 Tax=Streptomyces sp. NPDC007084 TaxID=3154313 RepID=UPI0034531AE9